MKYMLLIQTNPQALREFEAWPHEDVKRMVDYMHALNADLIERGELLEANGLTGFAQAKRVRARPDGDPVVTDGPFAESKEVLAGYLVVDVPDERRAIEIAARASAAPGRGGAPLCTPIVVHPVGEPPA